MSQTLYRGRRAYTLQNDLLQIIVTAEGGHIAAVTDKPAQLNPLWSPPWPSLEPSKYDRAKHPEYGDNSESKLLAGILGHNLCLDLFGAPSDEEAAAGISVHGEASVLPYKITGSAGGLTARVTMPEAQLALDGKIEL